MELAILVSLLFWGVALVGLCSRRDMDVHDKITWVVVLLVFNGLGAIVYFIFSPGIKNAHVPELSDDSRAVRVDDMQAWNPILGCNNGTPGEGLNSAEDEDVDGPDVERT